MQIKTKIVSCHTADSKPVKLEVNSTVILPSSLFFVFPDVHNEKKNLQMAALKRQITNKNNAMEQHALKNVNS
jgi:hypothetical protein